MGGAGGAVGGAGERHRQRTATMTSQGECYPCCSCALHAPRRRSALVVRRCVCGCSVCTHQQWACDFVFQRLFAAAACVRPAGGVVRAPLCRATVPCRPRACLHGHFPSRKSGPRAGAESGCMRRRGGCTRGAGGGRADRDYFSCRNLPLPCVGALERARAGGGRRPCLFLRCVLLVAQARAAPRTGPMGADFGPRM